MFPRRFLAVLFLVIMPGLAFALGADVPDYRQNGWSSPVDFRSHEYCAQFSQYSGDPVGYDGHVGNDMCREVYTPITAIADGCVEDYGSSISGYGGVGIPGGVVLLRHYTDAGQVFFTVYGHDTPDAAYLDARKCGSKTIVKKGEKIATVHSYYGSNNVRMDHLHIGIRPNEKESGRYEYRGNSCHQSDHCGWVEPFKFLKDNRPATLLPKGEQGFYQAGDYVLQGSDRCDTAEARFKIVDGLKSDSWVTKEVSQSEACSGVEKAIESTLQSAENNSGVVKVDDIVDVKKAPWWSSWISPLTSLWHSLFGLAQTPTALAADPLVQQQLTVYRTGEVYEIQGTNRQVVVLTDGPGMHGDKAIDWNAYAETDPTGEVFSPAVGANADGKRSDLVVTKLWTERSSGHVWDTIGWGDTVCFVAESKNAGNKDVSRDIKITFYVSNGRWRDKHPDPVGSEMIPAKYLTKARTAKATTRHCVNIHGDNYPSLYPGDFNFGAHIDPDNKEPESDEKNNWKDEQSFKLTENPHLSIPQIWFSNPNAQPGDGVTVYVRIRNDGTPFASSKVNTQWRVQGPQYGPDPIVIGVDQTKQEHLREEGDEAQEEVSFVKPTAPGDYVLSAEVDYDFRTTQSDRGGMTASIAFTIPETADGDEIDAVSDPSAPVSCPLITPDTWEIWSVQHYSPPFDWYEGNRLTISPICYPNQPERLDVVLGKDGDENVLVYKTAYVRNSKMGVDSTFTVECSSGKLWEDYCQGGARLTIAGPQADTSSTAKPTLILAYICHLVDNVWKCGCRDVTCTASGYQQQAAALAQ